MSKLIREIFFVFSLAFFSRGCLFPDVRGWKKEKNTSSGAPDDVVADPRRNEAINSTR